MPRQYVLFGRLLPRFAARRLTLLLLGLSVVALALIFTLPSGIPSPPRLAVPNNPKVVSHAAHLPHVGGSLSKSFLNPFRQKSHTPPHNDKDEHAGSSWLADWKWLRVPFSSTVTLDEDRALLPPLKPRQVIYCYYDATAKKSGEEKDAESGLLLTWRRAWWAQGFKPVILSAAEAMNNPSYDIVQRLKLDADFKTDLMRWLAWESMDGGILAHYTLLPTVPTEAPFLTYLRRGEYAHLTRWNDLGDFLFAGQKDQVKTAIKAVINMDPAKLKEAKDIISAVPSEVFKVDKAVMPLAPYTPAIISKKYPAVAQDLGKNRATGLQSLNRLITTHLHVAWQNRFSDGIQVLKPHPDHMGALVTSALRLARELASCADSPMPGSCPPNLPKCTPCVAMPPLSVSAPTSFRNSSKTFTIGTVPHPWTLASLKEMRQSFNVSWIRQESPRDWWTTTVTRDLLGTGVSSTTRVMVLKELVAGEHAAARSLWIAAETDMPSDMSWYFGFAIPETGLRDGHATAPVPADRLPDKQNKQLHRENPPVASPEERATQQPLIDEAKRVIALTEPTEEAKLRASLEAWNMADMEIWKFVRTFQSRRHQERHEWDKTEAKYSGGSGTEQGRSAWNRWQDRKPSSVSSAEKKHHGGKG
ncbi:uncharacterized protein UV8b_00715 [Ustilaginoidea virens]|uniref:Uncharacterized protein n=1 Tax=Ustilaginoidea virens TaxID=1159556 RepID=A0A063C051_USTVR|nr:uncharacterized protein UV8b_00715 [Ustilaginoidea virens]QUC16474.1 hypothetical protein UV8b_00715 [Ustilaginoidea virens]GAO13312.1 hypothetical protein UVI_02013260 [Ustilaginoidea virens]